MTTKKRPVKAYKNIEFLTSPDARIARIMCECLEPLSRFKTYGIEDTVVFFGSSRIQSKRTVQRELKALQRQITQSVTPDNDLIRKEKIAQTKLLMSKYYEDAVELSRLLTDWARHCRDGHRFVVCSGGGPGIMEAANRGAAKAGGESIGLNISLPHEQKPNPYISDQLSFEFHYFFMRKFWFMNLAKALIVFPGGFGTIDELVEVLTLMQTKKISKRVPILIYGSDYWNEVLNFNAMVKWGTISPSDLNLFNFANTPKDAFELLKTKLMPMIKP
ncbi:MAG: TIGR00730 family Rossman fold protein [bacterium]